MVLSKSTSVNYHVAGVGNCTGHVRVYVAILDRYVAIAGNRAAAVKNVVKLIRSVLYAEISNCSVNTGYIDHENSPTQLLSRGNCDRPGPASINGIRMNYICEGVAELRRNRGRNREHCG